MMKPDQIPDESVEAAAKADYEAWRDWADLRSDTLDWEYLEEDVQEEHRISARVTIAAALEAWPGAHVHEWQRPWLGGMSGTDIVIPLPTEKSDAEA